MTEQEIRLDQTQRVFDTIAELISKNETCTYRYLIYDLLGFDAENYAELMSGLTITNALVEREEQQEEIERLNNIINELEKYINKTKLEEFEKVYGKRYGKTFTQAEVVICNMILDKLKELKEK